MLKFEEGKKRKGGINWMVGEDGGDLSNHDAT